MNEWLLLLIVTAAGALLSLLGGFYLLYGGRGAAALQRVAVPLAAGALLAAIFFDLLPEALEGGRTEPVLATLLGGFLLFFVLERSLSWFHHHHEEADVGGRPQRHRNVPLIIIGDSLHNFIDGLAIGAAFLVSPATGVITAVAVAAHEIPQEIGDFGLLLDRMADRRRVLLVNVFSSLLTVAGAAAVFAVGGELAAVEPILLALTAGCFLYIAASDIIPTIHAEPSRRVANLQTAVLLLSVAAVAGLTQLAHGLSAH